MATSGGRDSTALLHATVRAARGVDVQVVALHVHHGLNPDADGWVARLQRQCRRWGVELRLRRLQASAQRGQSIEAWARCERYAALTEMAVDAGCGLVLLAHHRRDQAETWLLQALRGGGPAGLSAMPGQRKRAGICWARPWLDFPREAIDAYVKRHRLTFSDDDSNADPRFARNRLRLQVWPALQLAFADVETSLAGAARQAQQAAALAAEVADSDLPLLCTADGRLQTLPWRDLPPARRRNALAAWLAQHIEGGVQGKLLERLMQQLPASTAARWPVPGGELRLYRTLLSVSAAESTGAPENLPHAVLKVDLSLAAETLLPTWNGRFHIEPTQQGGVQQSLLARLETRKRGGGERFRLHPGAAARSLKLQYQSMGIPAWERSGPLLYTADDRLLFVPGLGVEGLLQAERSAPQWRIVWIPDAGPTIAGRR
ncbi:MAG: tRNA lysidine(34) synthetase TilS [Pseudomonadota bacterium]|nr:tRNA lysidine(34) synthetase TilS [Pseudomonadota bacterium]